MKKVTDDLAEFEGWTGDVSELARLAGEILAARGLADASTEPTVRVIRDYAQRGIVSRAERQGKEAIYGYRQLLEFVAARVLVADGWPLAKIAEHFAHIADTELRNLISGDQARNRALAVAQRLRSEAQLAPPGVHAKPSRYRSSLDPADDFRQRAARLSSVQVGVAGGLAASRPAGGRPGRGAAHADCGRALVPGAGRDPPSAAGDNRGSRGDRPGGYSEFAYGCQERN